MVPKASGIVAVCFWVDAITVRLATVGDDGFENFHHVTPVSGVDFFEVDEQFVLKPLVEFPTTISQSVAVHTVAVPLTDGVGDCPNEHRLAISLRTLNDGAPLELDSGVLNDSRHKIGDDRPVLVVGEHLLQMPGEA